MPELAQTTDGLHPPKDLFHEFSFPLTHVITRMPGGPTINRTPADLLRHVRDVPDADIGDEACHIVALVCSDLLPGGALASSNSAAASRSAVPVAWVAQTLATSPCRLSNSTWPDTRASPPSLGPSDAASPPDQSSTGACRCVAVEVDRGIPGVIGGRARRGVPASEALQAGPGFQLRPVHREMLVREQTGRPGVGLDRIKEGGRDIPRQQPVTILGKDARPGRPYSSRRTSGTAGCMSSSYGCVQHRQGPQQLLRRDTDVPSWRRTCADRLQRVIRQRADRAGGFPHALFRRQVTELGLIVRA